MRVFVSIIVLAILSACTLSQTPPGANHEDNLSTTAPPTSTTNSALVAKCDPNTPGATWYLYTANAGDTVESVIQQVGSTREMVMSGNCWTEIPIVSAGDQWYMPPASVDPLPDLSNVPVGGKLDANPSTYGEGGTWSLLEKHITLSLTDYPANTASVFFYVRTNGAVIGIGTDADLSDGASIGWDTLPNLTYFDSQLAVVAYDASGTPLLKTLEFGFNTM